MREMTAAVARRSAGARASGFTLITLLAACSSCGLPAPSSDDGLLGERGNTMVFDCARAPGEPFELTLRRGPGELALWLPLEFGIPYTVLSQTEPDGPYREGDVTLVLRDDAADLTVGAAAFTGCSLDPLRSIWEHAKLSGVDFRAAGTDPDWFVEIGAGRSLHFRSRRNDTDVVVATPEPESDPAAMRTVYRAALDSREIEVEIVIASCAPPDVPAMMGSYTEVRLDGMTFVGCGRALH